jgi:hypothetical protein
MVRKRKNQDSRASFLWLVCWLAAFHPNCARCCPDDSCKYAWEDCPASKGCSSCNFGDAPTGAFEAGLNAVAPDPVQAPGDPPGGTIAFVPSSTGAFVVSAIPARDVVHVVHLEATSWDEDPLTIRTIGNVAFAQGENPGRVVASHAGRVHVVLRHGGAIAAIDAATATLVARTTACAEPHGLAYDPSSDVLHAACASGEILTLSAATNQEVKHQFVIGGLEDIALAKDSLVASTRTRVIRIGADGSLVQNEAKGSIVRGVSGDVMLAFTNEKTAFATLTGEGAVGPWMAVRSTPSAASDLDVGSNGTVGVIAGGEAFILASGAAEFEPAGAPGIARAIAIGTITTGGIERRVVAVQTDEPRMLVFLGAGNPPVVLGIEPM